MNLQPETFEFTAEAEHHEVFSEAQIHELAHELLAVSNEQEFDHFLGGLIRRAGSAIGSAIRSPLGQHLGGVLKGVAKQYLPQVGSALGGLAGGALGSASAAIPGVGSAIAPNAANLGRQGGAWLGGKGGEWLAGKLELEGLSHEEMEVEIAKQFVRVAADATRNAAAALSGADPAAVAQSAVSQAVQQVAPGLLRSGPRATSGRWVRRGRTIILYGA